MQRACAVCGKPFESAKPQARYCGGTCAKRAQRSGMSVPRSGQRHVVQVVGRSEVTSKLNVTPDDQRHVDHEGVHSVDTPANVPASTSWLVKNLEFARGLLPTLELSTDLLSALAAEYDSGHQCTQVEWDTVAALLADRLIGSLTELKGRGGDFDGWPALETALLADMDRFAALLGDEVDDRVITELAAALPGAAK